MSASVVLVCLITFPLLHSDNVSYGTLSIQMGDIFAVISLHLFTFSGYREFRRCRCSRFGELAPSQLYLKVRQSASSHKISMMLLYALCLVGKCPGSDLNPWYLLHTCPIATSKRKQCNPRLSKFPSRRKFTAGVAIAAFPLSRR